MNSGSLHLFNFKGVPIQAHWTLIVFMLFRIFKDNDSLAFKHNLSIALIFLVTVIIHELGHALTARSLGGRAHKIILWPLGGLAYTSGHGTLLNSLKVTLGGPLTHLPLALLFAIPATIVNGVFSWQMFSPFFADNPATNFWGYILVIGVKVQMIMFLFNLFVPAYPLDCGHVIVESMLLRGKSPELTARVIVALSSVVSVVLLLYFQMPIIGIFIIYSTWQLNQLRVNNRLQEHPLFHMALRLPKGTRTKKHKHLSLVKKREVKTKQRTCPFCSRVVPEKALMCGFCEKEIPKS